MLFFYLAVVTFLCGVVQDVYRLVKGSKLSIRKQLEQISISLACFAVSSVVSLLAMATITSWDVWTNAFMSTTASLVLIFWHTITFTELTKKLTLEE